MTDEVRLVAMRQNKYGTLSTVADMPEDAWQDAITEEERTAMRRIIADWVGEGFTVPPYPSGYDSLFRKLESAAFNPEGERWVTCHDCGGAGCEYCEDRGRVLLNPEGEREWEPRTDATPVDSSYPADCPKCGALRERAERAEAQRDDWQQAARVNKETAEHFRKRSVDLQARVRELEGAIENARYALDPNQGERPDPTRAHLWLRTTLPPDHPNYIDPDTLEGVPWTK